MGIPACYATKKQLESDSIAGGNRTFVINRIKSNRFFANAAFVPVGRKRLGSLVCHGILVVSFKLLTRVKGFVLAKG
jgi:hypothetical protein